MTSTAVLVPRLDPLPDPLAVARRGRGTWPPLGRSLGELKTLDVVGE